MAHESFLSTRLEVVCPRCLEATYKLADPTDVVAERPVTVPVYCPNCGKLGHVTLSEGGRERTSQPPRSPEDTAAAEAAAVAAGVRRSSQTAISGVDLTSRYSLRADELGEQAEEKPRSPTGRASA